MSTSADERRLVQSLPAVLGPDEVMTLLGLSPPTLRRLVKDGHLAAHRLPGGRKWLFRADEVLDSISSWPAGDEEDDEQGQPPPPPTIVEPHEDRVDPATVWCPAPPRDNGADGPTLTECAKEWVSAARRSGLDPVVVSKTEVAVAGQIYVLRTGPRERVRVVDDDGEDAWQLIDAVWAEPAEPGGGST